MRRSLQLMHPVPKKKCAKTKSSNSRNTGGNGQAQQINQLMIRISNLESTLPKLNVELNELNQQLKKIASRKDAVATQIDQTNKELRESSELLHNLLNMATKRTVVSPAISMPISTVTSPLTKPTTEQKRSGVLLAFNPSANDENNTNGTSIKDRLLSRIAYRTNLYETENNQKLLPFTAINVFQTEKPSTAIENANYRLVVLFFWTVSERLQTHESDVRELLNGLGVYPSQRAIVVFLRGSTYFPSLPPLRNATKQGQASIIDVLDFNVKAITAIDWTRQYSPIEPTFSNFWKYLLSYLKPYSSLQALPEIPIDSLGHLIT